MGAFGVRWSRFPPDVIVVAVRWYLRDGLSYRDAHATRRFFRRALATLKVVPVEVVTDAAAVYPAVLDDLVDSALAAILNLRIPGGGL